MSESTYVTVARTEDIPQNTNKAFDVEGKSILICHAKTGEFFAVENRCSHAIAELEGGRMRGHRLICPLHGAAFDMRDGKVLGAPAYAPIKAYPVRVEDDEIKVQVDES
ncbi:MAG: non-heme iron oxygenase ferredoxin subunit [Alphaproteobacteria bacterium]|nr:MAG: non-heme iron oxygenase ferredoxin subunit [Alphaproteobacteria bacterium]